MTQVFPDRRTPEGPWLGAGIVETPELSLYRIDWSFDRFLIDQPVNQSSTKQWTEFRTDPLKSLNGSSGDIREQGS